LLAWDLADWGVLRERLKSNGVWGVELWLDGVGSWKAELGGGCPMLK